MAITRAEVNTDVNNKIRYKTTSNKVDNVEDADNRNLILDYVDDKVAAIPQGPQGPQGPAGNNGLPGPIGPAGLNWQGAWDEDASYAIDDAVGWNGSSWFCISVVNTTSNPFPDEDVAHWALLANQGAQGPQGPQGPLGPQGPGIIPKTSGTLTLTGTFQVLPFDINSCSFQGGKAFLPTTTENGKEIIVLATANNIEVRANSAGTNFMFVKFQNFLPSVTLAINEVYRFTYVGFGGYWKAELLESGIPIIVKTIKVKLTSADILALNSTPKLLIPAVPGKLLSLNFIHQRYVHATTAYTANGNGQIRYGSGVNNTASQFGLAISNPDTFYGYVGALISNLTWTDYVGQSVFLSTTGGTNPTGGDGTLDLFIEYTEIPIS